MMVADGRGYAMGGVAGNFAVDAGIGIIARLLMGSLLYRLPGETFGAGAIGGVDTPLLETRGTES
jgi:hypothetical protein